MNVLLNLCGSYCCTKRSKAILFCLWSVLLNIATSGQQTCHSLYLLPYFQKYVPLHWSMNKVTSTDINPTYHAKKFINVRKCLIRYWCWTVRISIITWQCKSFLNNCWFTSSKLHGIISLICSLHNTCNNTNKLHKTYGMFVNSKTAK